MVPRNVAVRLNQYAQDIRPTSDAKAWFAQLDEEQKRNVLLELGAMLQQAHPLPSELPAAVVKAELKPTHTPVVLMNNGPTNVQIAKVVALPRGEQEKAFLLFIALLGIADARRRSNECEGGCSHWWHRNLADERTVQTLVNDG